MDRSSSLLVRITLARLHQSPLCLARALQPARQRFFALARALRLSRRERRFALALTRRKTNLWLFRVHQRAFAGDLVVVDMACQWPSGRRLWILELKREEPLRQRSVSMHQLQNAPAAVQQLTAQGVVAKTTPFAAFTGDAEAVLRTFGVHA